MRFLRERTKSGTWGSSGRKKALVWTPVPLRHQPPSPRRTHVRAGVSNRAALEEDLERLVADAGGPRALGRCERANVPEFRLVPLLQLWFEIPAERFTSRPPGQQASGLRVTIPRGARRSYVLDPLRFDPVRAWQRQESPRLPILARSDTWQLAGRCR